ncbi:urate hydroxylase PuuD [Alteromonas sp. a30]|uniref:urate hydroxylase PuuD n=1 Tax=Alteromonas sp. a30 TaxID=2730917 RepID=UPI002282B770|nr:urate hydroxylase PuuD [Alteromonas sp. a30]MCY7293891.1 urate hydroxylase PuuD [Alteromonas sp. a30]
MPWLDWFTLAARWFHVVVGVAWIGASFYFIWLDNNLKTPPKWKLEKGIKGDLWAVHGGGFYEIAKYQYGPETMPEPLHWFKWEAYSTWLSGMLLLSLVYYLGASAYLIDPNVMPLTPTQAVIYGVVYIFGGIAIYEAACRSPLAKSAILFAIFLVAFLTFAAWLATNLFSARGAYIHVGALIGSIMAGNVFLNIMPGQRKMVAAVANKQDIDPAWGAGAKLRSVHNNYLTLPLLFIMISNHYPMTYQHPQNWLVLVLMSVVLAWVRHYFNLKHQGTKQPLILVTGFIGFLCIALWVSWPSTSTNADASVSTKAITQQQIQQLIEQHCVTCHSAQPTDDVFKVAPLGVKLDSWAEIQQWAPKIMNRVSVTKDMPFLNKTNMTETERQLIAQWYQQSIQ